MDLGPDGKGFAGIANEGSPLPGCDHLVTGEPAIEGMAVDPDDQSDPREHDIETVQGCKDRRGRRRVPESRETVVDGHEAEDRLQPEVPTGEEDAIDWPNGGEFQQAFSDAFEKGDALACSRGGMAISAEHRDGGDRGIGFIAGGLGASLLRMGHGKLLAVREGMNGRSGLSHSQLS